MLFSNKKIKNVFFFLFPPHTVMHKVPGNVLAGYLTHVKTVEALDTWAKTWGLKNNAEVKRRRDELVESEGTPTETAAEAEKDEYPPLKYDVKELPAKSYTLRSKRYEVKEKGKRQFKDRVIQETIYDVTFAREQIGRRLDEMEGDIREMFDDIIDSKRHPDAHFGRIYIQHEDLMNPIVIPPTPLRILDGESIMAEVSRVVQSADKLRLKKNITVHIGIIKAPAGGRGSPLSAALHQSMKKSVLCVRNTGDYLCAARAMALAIHYIQRDRDERALSLYRRLRRSRKALKDMAVEYHRRAGVPTTEAVPLTRLWEFEKALDVRIIVVSAINGNNIIYTGLDSFPTCIYLYMVRDRRTRLAHYHAIINIRAFFGCSYYCEKCQTKFNNKDRHSCRMWCRVCSHGSCPDTSQDMVCEQCNARCRSPACYERHKKGTNSACERFWYCPTCLVREKKANAKQHSCGIRVCKRCMKSVPCDHDCYMRAITPKNACDKFGFFDFECTQDDGVHRPNMAVIQTRCRGCITADDTALKCERCGRRCDSCRTEKGAPCMTGKCGDTERVFKGCSTLDRVAGWMFNKKRKGFTFLAHNNSGYDCYFLIDWLLHQSYTPEVIYSGSKILSLEVKHLKIRLLDSMRYMPMALDRLPGAMGFPAMTKGYFPYLFNTEINTGYNGPWPEARYYNPGGMSPAKKNAFMKWHAAQVEKTFDLDAEMLTYCRNDVDILRRACVIFRREVMNKTGLDPFNYITIASVCMADFRYEFLEESWMMLTKQEECLSGLMQRPPVWEPAIKRKGRLMQEDTVLDADSLADSRFVSSPIAVVRNVTNMGYSMESIQWLKWLEEEARLEGRTLEIQHALNGGEVQFSHEKGTYRVDGYATVNGVGHVYEFHGCFWHGCPTCHPRTSRKNAKAREMDVILRKRRMATLTKKKFLEGQGLRYKCIWEHEFKTLLAENEVALSLIDRLDVEGRLVPRDAFYGGRTEAFSMWHRCEVGERICYKDFISLYSSMMKYCIFPVGHPDIITGDFGDMASYFGLAKVRMRAPDSMFIPVLPHRGHGKLLFALCRSCAAGLSHTACSCLPKERALTGTWCTLEIAAAVARGYTIEKIYEVYHWTTTTDRLFTLYVNSFVQMKEEASGYPPNITTEEERENYIAAYAANEDVHLRGSRMKHNAGMRSIAKLCNNSLWGKMAQRGNMTKTTFVTTAEEFYSIVCDPTRRLVNFNIIADDVASVEWCYDNNYAPEAPNTNIYIAIFTTCHARLRLLDVLDVTGVRTLYCDTDSVIYSEREEAPLSVPTGPYLNCLKDELDCKSVGCPGCESNHYIKEFVAGGPKNYAYITDTGATFCKIRGFTLDSDTSEVLNMESLRAMVSQTEGPSTLTTTQTCIRRDKKTSTVFSRQEDKKYKICFSKRVPLQDGGSRPYGCRHPPA